MYVNLNETKESDFIENNEFILYQNHYLLILWNLDDWLILK